MDSNAAAAFNVDQVVRLSGVAPHYPGRIGWVVEVPDDEFADWRIVQLGIQPGERTKKTVLVPVSDLTPIARPGCWNEGRV